MCQFQDREHKRKVQCATFPPSCHRTQLCTQQRMLLGKASRQSGGEPGFCLPSEGVWQNGLRADPTSLAISVGQWGGGRGCGGVPPASSVCASGGSTRHWAAKQSWTVHATGGPSHGWGVSSHLSHPSVCTQLGLPPLKLAQLLSIPAT